MTTSSFLPNHSRQDIEHLTFAERVQFGAENAVRCMGVTASDRVFIITDYERESIARHVATAVLDCHANVTVHFLEHYGERPLTTFSDELRNDLIAARGSEQRPSCRRAQAVCPVGGYQSLNIWNSEQSRG